MLLRFATQLDQRRITLLQYCLLVAITLIVFFPCELAASRIEVSDGSILFGNILNRSGEYFVIRMYHGGEARVKACNVVRAKGENFDISIYKQILRFSGSNTVGEALLPAIAERYAATKNGKNIQWDLSPNKNQKTLKMSDALECTPRIFEIKLAGSRAAFRALERDETDIGMSSRRVKQVEVDKLTALGNLTDPTAENVLALDGLAIIVHPSNPVEALSELMVAQIFAGEVTDWSNLGGNPGPINIYARNDDAGIHDTFKVLSLKKYDRSLSNSARRFESSKQLSDAVQSDPRAIGFVELAHIGEAKPVQIKECGISYSPSIFLVKTEEYPLVRRLYLYIPTTQESLAAKDFIRFALSDEGQQIVTNTGFVDLAIEPGIEQDMPNLRWSRAQAALSNAQNKQVVDDYIDMTEGATRLSVTFRFQNNTSTLDNRARADIKRLATYLNAPEWRERQLMLLGFSDAQGDYDQNLALSNARAEAVANELMHVGIQDALVKGFGEEIPVACNDDSVGRKKNRHVEVWLK